MHAKFELIDDLESLADYFSKFGLGYQASETRKLLRSVRAQDITSGAETEQACATEMLAAKEEEV
jgi:hypothetical protein